MGLPNSLQAMDYRKTLNLPRTDFPIKFDPVKTETLILNTWKDLNVYERRIQLNRGKPKFSIYMPPQPAHGDVSADDAFNMITKDMIVKYKLMSGLDVPVFPIWNCHVPAVERKVKDEKHESQQIELLKQCREDYAKYINIQKEQFQRLGIFAYWNKTITTLDSRYESMMIDTFLNLYESGYLYRGIKPNFWCINCQSDLKDVEVEYRKYDLLSLYVKFPILSGMEDLGEDVYMLVWVNTPWTLLMNRSIAVNPDYVYAAVQMENGEIIVMADELVGDIMGRFRHWLYKVVKRMKGLELSGIICAHPLIDRDSKVVLDRQVSLVRGTGCVHNTLPNLHQKEHHSRKRSDLEMTSSVDQNGLLTEEAGKFYGHKVFDSGDSISLELEKRGYLLAEEPLSHVYPHCSYCKQPIIVRSNEHWILDLEANNLRQRILKVIEEVNWFPRWIGNGIYDTIMNLKRWGISRRRIWGIPIPVFYCRNCDLQIDVSESIKASKGLIGREGFTRWLVSKPEDILPDDVSCDNCGERNFRWEIDTMDPEFVSGLSFKAIPLAQKTSHFPWDVYLGNNNKEEKCLQSSLLSSMAIEGCSPFKSAVVHGPVIDENTLPVPALLDKFGADVLRCWTISMDCKKRLRKSDLHIKLAEKAYTRIRNTCRFLLANLYDYDPANDRVNYEYLQEIDRWAFHKLAKLTDEITKAFENFQFHNIFRLLLRFCSVDMSSIYFTIVKRRLYTSPQWSSSRRSVQTVMYEVLTVITKLMAPVFPFTAEELWSRIPQSREECPSVHLSSWPQVNKDFLDAELESRWDRLLKIRSEMHKSIEKTSSPKIKNPAQAFVILYAEGDTHNLLDGYVDNLEEIFGVSKVRLMPPDVLIPDDLPRSENIEGLAIEIRETSGTKCERCWIYSDTVGTNEQYPTLCHRCITILEGKTYYV